jgi:YVTN family beta-propeller protein
VAVTCDGAYGFVAQHAAGTVAMLDPSTHRLLATITVGGSPTALVTGPYPPAVSGLAALIVDIAVIGLLALLMTYALVTSARYARKRRTQLPPTAAT